jgi:hypothetical protein
MSISLYLLSPADDSWSHPILICTKGIHISVIKPRHFRSQIFAFHPFHRWSATSIIESYSKMSSWLLALYLTKNWLLPSIISLILEFEVARNQWISSSGIPYIRGTVFLIIIHLPLQMKWTSILMNLQIRSIHEVIRCHNYATSSMDMSPFISLPFFSLLNLRSIVDPLLNIEQCYRIECCWQILSLPTKKKPWKFHTEICCISLNWTEVNSHSLRRIQMKSRWYPSLVLFCQFRWFLVLNDRGKILISFSWHLYQCE